MFKSKKIVALVLCAMMLFVPVAAMAADTLTNVNFLKSFVTEVNKDAVLLKDEATDGSLKKAVKTFTDAFTALENDVKAGNYENIETQKVDPAKEALKAYEEIAKKAKEYIANLESMKKNVESFKFTKYVDSATEGYKTADQCKETFKTAVTSLKTKSDAVANDIKVVEGKMASYKLYLELVELNKKATEAQNKVETAAAQVKSLADLYNVHANADEQTEKILRAQLEDAWKKFAAMATEFQKASVLSSVSGDAKDVLNKGETKYEVKSTGEKGWILSDEAKNGCLKDVAEFKVEKKDGKFVAKVYGADGKEMKIGQQLTVYRPIAKDVKVLSAKVDGKNVTFATSVRNGQNYVSVPVVY